MGARGEAWQAEVLGILQKNTGPLTAYEVLEHLRARHDKIAPPTVYRALAALTENGQIHRLESLNAYVTCQHEGHSHGAIMSICDDCGSVEERVSSELLSSLSSEMKKSGFSAARHVIEIHGTCANCGPERSS